MAGWFEKLIARAKSAGATPVGADTSGRTAEREPAVPAEASVATSAAAAEGPVNAARMFEIVKLLAQIEYGIEVEQIAASLSLSPEEAQANCEALEQEMFVHHHDDLGEWFIAQRGLEFLRLHGSAG